MPMMKLLPILIVLPGFALLGCEDQQSDPSLETVKKFYSSRIESQANGMPSLSEISQMAPYISKELRALLDAASAEYAGSSTKSASEEKIEDGDWFTSMFNGPTSFIVGEVQSSGTKHIVSVRFTSAQQLPAVNWRDRIVVIEEEGHHVIANVEYENHWAFQDNTTLVDVLKDPKARRKHPS